MKKKICIILLVVLLVPLYAIACSKVLIVGGMAILSLTGDNRAEKEDIIDYVYENEEELLMAIEQMDFSDYENQGIIKEVRYDNDVIEFSCGGYGWGSATGYVGFYYVPDDDMRAIWCAPSYAGLKSADEGYEYRSGDNYYYTENICGHFYYYEAAF